MKRRLINFSCVGLFLFGGLCLIALFMGISRYGSFQAFRQRIEVEIANVQPKEPIIVPTFIPEEQLSGDDFVAALEISTEPVPTPTPTIVESPTLRPPISSTVVIIPPTEIATSFPTPTHTPTVTPTPIHAPTLDFVNLTGYQHNWQTWNNCGPATIATYLSFHGKGVTQAETATVLKPNEKDKNVRVEEIVAYVEQRFPDLIVKPLINGSPDTLRLLLSNNFPVMLQTWLEEDPDDGMGHYRFLVGYDEATSEWIASDSYVSTGVTSPYAGIRIDNQRFLDHWLVFDNLFILIYEAEEEPLIESILGENSDPVENLQQALEDYTVRLQANDQNPFLWHTMGDLLLQDGRPEQAAQAYDQARAIGLPWRMFWYNFGVFEAYAAVGRYQDLIGLADVTIESGGPGEEIYYWKGVAHRALGEEARAQEAFHTGLWWNPTHQPTIDLLSQ